jgi:ketosteroid isomerase-like protein
VSAGASRSSIPTVSGGSAETVGLTDVRFGVTEVIDVPPHTVVVVGPMRGRGRASGVEISAFGAAVWTLRNGQVTGVTMYQAREQALKAVGLEE